MRVLSNQETKIIKRYKMKKFRSQDKIFLAEGKKLVSTIINSRIIIKDIIISEDYKKKNSIDEYRHQDIAICSDSQFKKISNQNNPDGIIAICEIPDNDITIESNEWVIALDSLQDPGNLGTIIRIADWFGIKKIVCSTNTVDAYNPKVIQSTMGSIANVGISYKSLIELLKSYHGEIYGATLSGANIYNLKNSKPGLIIIGNESNGISKEVLNYITKEITIPKLGNAESLNAGVATAIIVSHFLNS